MLPLTDHARLLASALASNLRVVQWTPGGPYHVYVTLVTGERREVEPGTAELLLALLERMQVIPAQQTTED